MPVNLRVPPDASKRFRELIEKLKMGKRSDSDRSSISLRIPNRSLASLSDLTTTLTTVTTLEDSPLKERKGKRKSLKRIGLKSVHQAMSRARK